MKKISELNNEELKKIFNSSEKLFQEVLNDYKEYTINVLVDDMLRCFNTYLNDYSIGFNNYNYIKVNEEHFYNFLEGIKRAINDYEFLDKEYKETINNLQEKINTLYLMNYDNKNYCKLEKYINDKMDYIINVCIEKFNELTSYNTKDIEEYFIGFYADEMGDTYYIDDNGRLFKHVEYEKEY